MDKSAHVAPVVHLGDVITRAQAVCAVAFEHVARRVRAYPVDRDAEIGETGAVRGSQTVALELVLPERAVAFQAIAERAAADDLVAFAPQAVLQLASGGGFENYYAFGPRVANPGQLRPPVRGSIHHAAIDALRVGGFDVHANLVTGEPKPIVHVAQIALFADTKEPHDRSDPR
ncbi:MAG: hypothetical protein ACXWVP_05325 [Burkholderiales bacterium]